MRRDELNDLAAFALIAREGSFTRAAAALGMSQSALSHAMRGLEERLTVRLLSRTTRSVSTTEAGELLLKSLRPALEDIAMGLAQVGAMSSNLIGLIRLTATRNAFASIVLPVLPTFLVEHPNVRLELNVDDNLTDIVANRFDAGIRFGNIIDQDMIAVRIGPDMRRAVVASPQYLANNEAPVTPHDLATHNCIRFRLVKTGGLYTWEFDEGGQPLHVKVDGSLIFNDNHLMHRAAVAGMGVAFLYEDDASEDISSGKLVRLLDDWCAPLPGYYLYHPGKRQSPPALSALITALRVNGRTD